MTIHVAGGQVAEASGTMAAKPAAVRPQRRAAAAVKKTYVVDLSSNEGSEADAAGDSDFELSE